MRQQLWLRLVLAVIGGMVLLTLVGEMALFIALTAVRNHAIDNASRILEEQVAHEMREHTMNYATEANATLLRSEKLVGELADVAANLLVQPVAYHRPDLKTASNGVRAYYGGQTAVLLASTVNTEDALDDALATILLDSLLPMAHKTDEAIYRVSYLSSSGMVRTYPQLNAEDLEPGWDPLTFPEYTKYMGASDTASRSPEPGQWDFRTALDGKAHVLVRVAPVFRERVFHGLVIVEIDASRLLPLYGPPSREIPIWLRDAQGRLLSASVAGTMLYHSIRSLTLPQPVVHGEPEGRHSLLYDVKETDRPFLLIEAPVGERGWSLFLAAPLDRFQRGARELAPGIISYSNLALLISGLVTLGITGMATFFVYRVIRTQLSVPIEALIEATNTIASGDLSPIPVEREDELGKLTLAFNAMTKALLASREETEQQTVNLTQTVRELEQSLRTQRELWKTLQRVSTPLIPVLDGTLVMPLIGNLDRSRLEHITEMVLKRIERESTRLLVVDVTGVAAIDEPGSQEFIHLTRAVQLLGCDVILVGVSAALAEALVSIGTHLEGIKTRTTLQSAMEEIIRWLH